VSIGQPLDQSQARLDIPAAAAVLGISEAALRKRIQRHQVASVKVDGHVYVVLDPSNGPVPRETPPASNGHAPSNGVSHALEAELAAYRDQVAFLRAELERKDAIIMRLIDQREPLQLAAAEASAQPCALETTQGCVVSDPPAEAPRPWWHGLLWWHR
jgi:hypothetical protein